MMYLSRSVLHKMSKVSFLTHLLKKKEKKYFIFNNMDDNKRSAFNPFAKVEIFIYWPVPEVCDNTEHPHTIKA